MKIGDNVYVHGYIDEIRNDTVIIRNNGGYFGTVPSEIISGELPQRMRGRWIPIEQELPKDGAAVWVTIKGHDFITCDDGETLEQAIERINKIRWVTQGYWSEEEHGWNDPSFGCPLMVQPVAWMPIDTPEPYKE